MRPEIQVLISCSLLLTIAVPLWHAWRAVKHSSLRHTMFWLWAAWVAWMVATAALLWSESNFPYRYLAVCLTACTIAAVLGARLPGMVAWNFVVAALLAVLLLPVVEQAWSSPNWHVDSPRAIVIASVLAVGLANYLPTRIGPCALGVASALLELAILAWPRLRTSDAEMGLTLVIPIAFAAPSWLTWWVLRHARGGDSLDAEWRAFRDCYGLIWARRVQEQFNASVKNGGGNERLTWRGLRGDGELTAERHAELRALLWATLKRFGMGCESKNSNSKLSEPEA